MFLAADASGKLIALKVMLEHLTEREASREAFVREAKTSALLRHPNLVEVFGVGEHDGRPWICMELVRGWSLSALQRKLRAQGARLDADEAAEIVRQAALGLHSAHELKGEALEPLGLIHRDVSPQNIMVAELGVAKVVDFGLVKATAVSDTVTAAIKGKLRYMPPEQLKSQRLDRRCDVFALGAVLWELACGAPLYPGASEADVFQQALFSPQPHPDEVAKGLSRGMVAVLLAATHRELDRRMATAKELAEALAPLSSPHARDKLGDRVSKLFEPLPRTLDEARAAANAGRGAAPKLLYPEGPVPVGDLLRERRTDLVTSPLAGATHVGLDALPEVPDEAFGESKSRGMPSAVTEANRPAPPIATEAENTDSGYALGTLSEGDTVATSNTGQTVQTIEAATLRPPSRAVIALTVCLSAALVAVGGAVGLALRDADAPLPAESTPPTVGEPKEPSPERAGAEDSAGSERSGLGTPPPRAAAKKPLGPRQGRIEIESNVPAVVRERAVELGATPFSRAFTAGRHRLVISTPDGSSTTELDLQLKAGQTQRHAVKLSPR